MWVTIFLDGNAVYVGIEPRLWLIRVTTAEITLPSDGVVLFISRSFVFQGGVHGVWCWDVVRVRQHVQGFIVLWYNLRSRVGVRSAMLLVVFSVRPTAARGHGTNPSTVCAGRSLDQPFRSSSASRWSLGHALRVSEANIPCIALARLFLVRGTA